MEAGRPPLSATAQPSFPHFSQHSHWTGRTEGPDGRRQFGGSSITSHSPSSSAWQSLCESPNQSISSPGPHRAMVPPLPWEARVCRGVGTRLPSLDGAIPFAPTQAPLMLWPRPAAVAAEGPATCGHTSPQAGPGWGTHKNGSEPGRPPALQPPFWTLLLKPQDGGSAGPQASG